MEAAPADVDYYEVLQVHERAIQPVIDGAYRALVRRYHPDVHPADKRTWAHSKMAQLNVAYDVLSDPVRRSEYDAARRVGRTGRLIADGEATVARGVKCFNHPKRPSLTFCWHCGRPICAECFGAEMHGHTVCVPCAMVIERERGWSPGMSVEERAPTRRPGRAMGITGLLAHYVLLTLLLGGVLYAVYEIALAFGNSDRQALLLALGLAVVFLIFVVQRLTWRVICPDCGATSGYAAFRATAPWHEFLAPQPLCPRCGRRFRAGELHQNFD